MKFIARVNPRYFAAASLFMGVKDVRYYLCGVAIQPHPEGGALVMATNGHVMFMAHDKQGFCEHDIIVEPTKALISACKKRGRRGDKELFTRAERLWISENAAVVQNGLDEAEPEPFGSDALFSCKINQIDGKFPNLITAMTHYDLEKKHHGQISFNATYLAWVFEAAKLINDSYTPKCAPQIVQHSCQGKDMIGCISHFRLVAAYDEVLISVMPMHWGADEEWEPVPLSIAQLRGGGA